MAEAGNDVVSFVLDGRPATAGRTEMLIAAAERAGVFIPRFCYHPRMAPVGMCRMCLVEVSGPRGATLQPACFIPAAEGMEVVTDSERVKKAQDGVLEFLLVNHPLDCPVCDKGGECPLQDQTLAYGPGESRFLEEKRHFEKPIALSDLVLLDRERCIQCARCTRFADEVAGEAQIDFAGRGERVEVSTFPTHPFSSYFSGNTVQICPVGALTATPYRFTARPWDLDQVESTCTSCALGCRVAVQSSGNRLTRLLGIDSEAVNHSWLCDKGRYAFESVNGDDVDAGPGALAEAASGSGVLTAAGGQFAGEAHEAHGPAVRRLTEPFVRKGDELVPVSWGEALAAAAEGLSAAQASGGPGAVAVLGGARLTNEAAYAWAKLAKGVLGTDSVDAQLGDGLPADLVLSLPRATIAQACSARAVVLLTADVREELPVLFLRLRQAALAATTSLVELSPTATSLSPYAAVRLPVRPGDSPALARALLGDDAAAAGLRAHPEGPAWSDDDLAAARRLVASGDGEGIVVVVGRQSLAEGAGVGAAAARALAEAWPAARFLPALRRGNVNGALDMGLAPGLLPGHVRLEDGRDWFAERWGAVPAAPGLDAVGILSSLAGGGTGGVRALVLVGADPVSDFCDGQLAAAALERADFVVAVSGHPNESVARADVVLPAAVAHEQPGTTTNIEGRVTRLGQKLVPPGSAWDDWMIAAELAVSLGADLGVQSLSDLAAEIERVAPAYAGVTSALLDSPGAHDGVLVPLARHPGLTTVVPLDPIAIPGVESVERQGAPPFVGRVEPPPTDEAPVAVLPSAGTPPPVVGGGGADPSGDEPHVAPPDSYSLRLVSTRRLYDNGSLVAGSPSLAALVGPAVARANPYDLDRIGADTGASVRLRSPRGVLVLPAERDEGVPRGTVAVDFNRVLDPESASALDEAGAALEAANAAAVLIDATRAVNEVRLESA
ncbi:MAG TPA: molybdopterin-dependent oxidoreductase [Acidimicrobiales bacterium]|nr:molybdopterin-dependent oxidoreductase [Acidimicrobiales bacterium]